MNRSERFEKHVKSNPPPEKWFTLFGLVVVRRTDLLAAAAFALSISTISYQLWQFVRGANPAMYHPDTVYVFFDKYANDVVATRFAGGVSFTNNGDAGHNAVIRDVSTTITVKNRTIEQYWTSFVTVSRRETELFTDIKESAHPVVVSGGSASSYTMTFSPRVRSCNLESRNNSACNPAADFVSDVEFLNLLSPNTTTNLKFNATVFNSRRNLESICTISVTDDMILTLAKNDWYSARCVSTEP